MTVEFETLSPEERTVRILVIGHPIALRRYQHIQHSLHFAEVNDWSPILLQPNSQRQDEAIPFERAMPNPTADAAEIPQGMTLLIKQLR